MQRIDLETTNRVELIDITNRVQAAIEKEKIKDGICLVFVPHTTAAVTVNENADNCVQTDINAGLKKIVPEDGGYSHREGNSDAHIKSSLVGVEVLVIIESGRLLLGAWQGVYFCEFDGPRTRQVWVKIIK